MKKFDSKRLLHSLILYDEVKKFAARCILHYQIELLWRLNYLIELDDVRVSYHLKNVDFAGDPLYIVDILNFIFFQNFNCHFFTCQIMNT